ASRFLSVELWVWLPRQGSTFQIIVGDDVPCSTHVLSKRWLSLYRAKLWHQLGPSPPCACLSSRAKLAANYVSFQEIMRISILVAPALLFLLTTADAANYVVVTNSDSGPGSLRQAILDANAGGG